MRGSPLRFGFELADRLGQKLDHGVADLVVGLIDALAVEIAPDLAEYVFLAGLLEVGLDHLAGIGLGIVARQAHLFGRPQPEQLVPPARSI